MSEPDATDSPETSEESILRDLRVLVVDDVADNCDVVDYLLSSHGAKVTVADSAAAGLLAMDAERFDVIVSDISMPEADGFEFLRRIRARGGAARQIPVIALTAFTSEEDRAAIAEVGFRAHVSKPVEPETLVVVVAAAAGRG